MAVKVKGKEYLSYSEQIAKNKEDIEELKQKPEPKKYGWVTAYSSSEHQLGVKYKEVNTGIDVGYNHNMFMVSIEFGESVSPSTVVKSYIIKTLMGETDAYIMESVTGVEGGDSSIIRHVIIIGTSFDNKLEIRVRNELEDIEFLNIQVLYWEELDD